MEFDTPRLKALMRITGCRLDASVLARGALISDSGLLLRQIYRHWGTGLSIALPWTRAWEAEPLILRLREGLVEDGRALAEACRSRDWSLELTVFGRFVESTPAVSLSAKTMRWAASLGANYDADLIRFPSLESCPFEDPRD